MYEKFYGLNEKPFEISPDPGFFFSSEKHREGLAHLEYAIKEGKSFTVLTGEVGSGKTILVHKLLSRLNGAARTAYIFNPIMGTGDFLEFICRDLGMDVPEGISEGKLTAALHDFLLQCCEKNEKVFLIIDEAQAIPPDLLEMVRMLTNLETSKKKLLNVILLGQPELKGILNQQRFRALKQRVTVRYDLKPLTRGETRDYILYRIKRANSRNLRIFGQSAIGEIYRHSKGIPRLINIICDNALLIGFSRGTRNLDKGVIREIARDLDISQERRGWPKWGIAAAALTVASVIIFLLWLYGEKLAQLTGWRFING